MKQIIAFFFCIFITATAIYGRSEKVEGKNLNMPTLKRSNFYEPEVQKNNGIAYELFDYFSKESNLKLSKVVEETNIFEGHDSYSKNLIDLVQKKIRDIETFSETNKSKVSLRTFNDDTNMVYLRDSSINEYYDRIGNRWYNEEKIITEFDEYGDIKCYYNLIWDDSIKVWNVYRKLELNYTENFNFREIVYYRWNDDSSKLVEDRKIELEVNEKGEELMMATYRWNPEKGIFVGLVKEEMKYDEYGELIKLVEYVFDNENDKWIREIKVEYEFNSNHDAISISEYKWKKAKKEWIGKFRIEIEYNEEGKTTKETEFDWDKEFNDWASVYKSITEYDDNKSTYTGIERNDSTGVWEEKFKRVTIVLMNGDISIEISNYWDYSKNLWIPSSKFEYSTDNRGNQTLDAYYSWNAEKEIWQGSHKNESKYDLYDQQIQYINYRWDTLTNNWNNETKVDYIFDTFGNRLSMIYYGWDAETGNWVGGTKYESTFDKDGNQTSYLESYMNVETKQWVSNYKYEESYDENGNLTMHLSSFWNKELSKWEYEYRATHYYSKHEITNIEKQVIQKTLVIYTESQKTLNIEIPENNKSCAFYVFDLNGKKVISETLTSSIQISAEFLNSGIYIYSLIIDNQMFTGKFKVN